MTFLTPGIPDVKSNRKQLAGKDDHSSTVVGGYRWHVPPAETRVATATIATTLTSKATASEKKIHLSE